jgi:hypothetical protein
MLVSCSGESKEKPMEQTDDSVVYVYYYHGKQRCKTCVAVEKVTKETIESAYEGNNKVKFVEVKTDDKANNALIEHYEIIRNTLIIAKGEQYEDITTEAFATAVKSPEVLAERIKTEINNYLD